MKKSNKRNDKINIEKSVSNKKNDSIVFSFIIFILLFVIVIVAFLISSKEKNGDKFSLYYWWVYYDVSVSNIVSNMEDITEPNDSFYWWSLKDFDIENEEYEDILNKLVADVRVCYMEFTQDGDNYANSNPILNYREETFISNEDLKQLRSDVKKSTCISRFEEYENLLISDDDKNRDKMLKLIEPFNYIDEVAGLDKEELSFEELVHKKYIEVSLVENLSAFLRSEYYRLK